tara:strand:+ start:70 stop:240 length:171 start_codon:yes stop_codon:yes gene_type:complete
MVTDADTSLRGTASVETVTTTDSGWGVLLEGVVIPWLITSEIIKAATRHALRRSLA